MYVTQVRMWLQVSDEQKVHVFISFILPLMLNFDTLHIFCRPVCVRDSRPMQGDTVAAGKINNPAIC